MEVLEVLPRQFMKTVVKLCLAIAMGSIISVICVLARVLAQARRVVAQVVVIVLQRK